MKSINSNKHHQKIIAIVFLIIISFLFNRKYVVSYVPTESMEPQIMRQSLCLSEKKVDKYEIGDIAIYDSGDKKIIHRIIDIKNGEYQFKGDNNLLPDEELVSKDKIEAKFIVSSRILGMIYSNVYLFVIILLMIIFFTNAMTEKNLKNYKAKEK